MNVPAALHDRGIHLFRTMPVWAGVLLSLLAVTVPADAAVCTSGTSGNWSAITWDCGTPANGDDIVIATNVTLDLASFTANMLTVNAGVTFDIAGNTFTITNDLSGTGTVNFTTGRLFIGGDGGSCGECMEAALTGSPDVTYDGLVAQLLNKSSYSSLTLGASNYHDFFEFYSFLPINIDNAVLLEGGAKLDLYEDSGFSEPVTLDGGGTAAFEMQGTSELVLGGDSGAVAPFPTNFSSYTLSPDSKVTYDALADQMISSAPVYGNLSLFLMSYSYSYVTHTPDGNLNVLGDLTAVHDFNFGSASLTLDMLTHNVTAGGGLLVDGQIAIFDGGDGTNTHTFGGDIQLASGGTIVDPGTFVLNGTGVQNIIGAIDFTNLTLQNSATIDAASSVRILGQLDLATHILTVAGSTPLVLGGSSSVVASTGYISGLVEQRLDATGVPKQIPVGAGGVSAPVTITVDSFSATPPGSFQVQGFATQPPSAPPGTANFYWELTPTNIGQADVTFTYDPATLSLPEADYRPARWNGTSWEVPPGATIDPATNTASVSNQTAFSPWTLIPAATCTVISSADSGTGTLREAINNLNSGTCGPTINFDISSFEGTGPHTIALSSSLPTITASGATIDGFTETGAIANSATIDQPVNASWQVVIDGPSVCVITPCAPANVSALSVAGPNLTVRGLVIQNAGTGIDLQGSGAAVTGNRLAWHFYDSIKISGPSNRVGGADADRNVIHDGSQNYGVRIIGSTAANNVIDGNHIGFDQSGAAAGTGNHGVLIDNAGTGNKIGTFGRGNVIGNSNVWAGVVVLGDGLGASDNGFVETNRIGTNLQGTAAAPNTDGMFAVGIYLDTVDGYTITGNLLSGHAVGTTDAGLYLYQSSGNTIRDNKIGTDIAGTGSIPNSYGIVIDLGSDNNVIGESFSPNTIENNGFDGIALYGGTGNLILENVIRNNGSDPLNDLPIDLLNDGPTANDVGDGDNGPNGLQNYPTLSNVVYDSQASTVTLDFALDSGSTGAQSIQVDFYRSDASFGHMVEHLGSTCFQGSSGGVSGFSMPSGGIGTGSYVTATANSYSDTSCNSPLDGASETAPASVVNTAPVATGDSYATNEDTTLSVAAPGVLGNDSDADGDPLTAVLDTTVSNGTLTLNADGSFSYTPAADFNGTDSFSYHANDGLADSNIVTVTLTITAVNDAPVATADSYSGTEDTVLSVAAPGVLGNDTDTEGDPLTAVLDTTVSNGTLTLNADGSFSYTPAADFNGTDSFSYHANDGTADSNIVTVTLKIAAVNDAPVATADAYSGTEDTVVSIAAPGVLSNDTDADGDPLTAVLDATVTNGTLTLNADGSFSYKPPKDFNGTDSFGYHAYDGVTDSNVVTVTLNIAPVNDKPDAVDDTATTPFETAVTIPVLANDSDPDGDSLTILNHGPAADGTVTCTTSDCTYTPDAGFSGTDSFTYTVMDPLEASDSATVTITVKDPTATDLRLTKTGPAEAARGSEIEFTIEISNIGPNNAVDTEVIDPTPSGLSFVSNSGACTTPFPCALGTVSPGQVRTIVATFSVKSGAPSKVTNGASVSATTADSNGANNTAYASVSITSDEPECPSEQSQIVAPLEGSVHENPVSFAWTAVDGATGYLVVADQGSGPVVIASTSETTATVSLPAVQTTWYVEAQFDDCPSTRSKVVSFTVEGGDCIDDSPDLFAPADGASALTSPVEFRWGAVAGASSYRVWVESEDSFPVVVGTTSATTLVATVPSGELHWYVQALFEGCPPTISEVRTIEVQARADCPTDRAELISPQPGTELDSPILFEWSPVDGAVRYAVWASVNGDTESIIGTTEGKTNTTLERTMDAGEIEWFVEVFFGGCPSVKTSSRSFTVNEDLACVTESPQPMLPAAEAANVPGLVKFKWSTVPTATGYRLWAKINGVGEFEQIGATLAETELQVPMRASMVTWYVEAVFDRCRPARSSEQRFFIRPTQNCDASASRLITPIGNVTLEKNRVNLVWTAVDGADAYNVWVSREDGAQSKVGLTSGSELSIEVDLEEGAHEWWVTAVFASCSPIDSEHELFRVDTKVPDECRSDSELLLLAPSEGAADIASPVIFEWSEVPDATGYQIWLLEGENDTPRPLGGVREDTQAVVQIQAGTVRWYVEAIRSGVCGPVRSPIQHFKVTPAGRACDIPDKPLVYVPQNVSTGTRYRISWDQVPGATVYEVQESTSHSFRDLPVRVVRGTSTRYSHTVSSGSKSFFYRVRAIGDCNGERSSYSPLAQVTVVGNASGASASRGYRLSAEDGFGSEMIELNKDAYSQDEIEEFTVVLRSPGAEPETVRLVPDQSWMTIDPEVVTLTPGGVTVTVRADMGDLPLGTSTATVRYEPVGGAKSGSQSGTSTVSVSLVTPVAQTGKNKPLPESLIIPAVAHADGLNSTWLSDIRLTNVGAVTQKYELNFTPAGVDGTQTGQSTSIDVQPGSTVALNDVLANWYGTVSGGSQTGMLEIRPMKSSTSSSIGGLAAVASGGFTSLASSRTYNLTPNGTFGQFIPAIRFEKFVGAGTEQSAAPRLSLQQISQSSAFRTNLGIVEASGNAVDALVSVFDNSGSLVGSFTVAMQPGEHKQLNSVLEQQGITVENGRIEISAANGQGRLMAYGSVVDNLTNDPQLVPAVTLGEDSGTRWVLPGVADLETGQASWRTDVRILNADGEPREVKLTYYPQNDPGAKKEASLTLNAGEIEILDDLLSSFFGETNTGGVVHVETEATTNLVTTGRTYNREADGGTFGQFIPAVNASRAIGRGEQALQVMQVEQSDRFRANLGLAEVTGESVQVEVSAVVPGAKTSVKAVIPLQGNEFTQLVGVLNSLGISEAYNARISVRVVNGDGRIVAYGSIVDNETQDPTYVPAQ